MSEGISERLQALGRGERADEVAIEVEGEAAITWASLASEAKAAADGLRAIGLRSGDSVLVMSADRANTPAITHGVLLAGGVVVPVDASTPTESLPPLIERGHAAFALIDKNLRDGFSAQQEAEHGEFVLLRLQGEREPIATPSPLALVIFTSGSTGVPKAVMLTHENLLAQTTRLAEIREHNATDRHLSFLSYGHFAEQFMSVWLHTVAGYCAVVTKQRKFVQALKVARPTFVMAVPVQWASIADAIKEVREQGKQPPECLQAVGLENVRLAIGTGAPLASEVRECLGEYGLTICEMYGMSESTGAATYNNPAAHRLGSVGKPLPGSRIDIDPDGEIRIVGSRFQSPGYVDQPEETAQTFCEGSIRTGDLGRLDEDGYLYITGRKKELLVMANGKKVHPGAIEAKLQALPGVRHAAVFGEGQRSLVALLDVEESARDELAANVDRLNARVSRHERIRSYQVVEPLTFEAGELTSSGKVRRAALQSRYQERIDELFQRP